MAELTPSQVAARAELNAQSGHVGRISGTMSALLLDLGSLLVIEFGRVESACYNYERRVIAQVVPDLWTAQSFDAICLQRSNLCLARVVRNEGWQEELTGILANSGIQPL